MPTGSNLRIGRVWGIPIEASWSWFVVFALIMWSLAAGAFPAAYPGLDGPVYLAMGLAAAVALFASIVLHELGHTAVARREGLRIRRITLWLFGGMAEMETSWAAPGPELRIAVAGPVVSALLAGGFWLVALAARAADVTVAVSGVAAYLGTINLILAVFNLLPALPLDGGRVLHAGLWRRQGDPVAATLTAARLGRLISAALIGLGVLTFLSGDVVGGIWIAFIGWFLLQAAQAEASGTVLRAAIEHLRVAQLMSGEPVTVPAASPLDEAARLLGQLGPRGRHAAYPVVDDGHLVGWIPWSTLVEAGAAGGSRVADVMVPRDRLAAVHPDQPVDEVLALLGPVPHRAVVVDGDHPVGMLAPADIERVFEPERERAEAIARRRRPGVGIWLGMLVALAGLVGWLYHPPYLVIEPGVAFNVSSDVTISGVATHTPSGTYDATSVRLVQPNLLGLGLAAIRTDREVLRQSDVLPANITTDDYDAWQRRQFLDSRQLAAAAAARVSGYTATVTGGGALVLGLVPSTPAAAVLRAGDLIVAVDGQPVQLAGDLSDLISPHTAGTPFRLTVVRSGQTSEMTVASTRLSDSAGGIGIGVLADTADLRVSLPFTITFADRPGVEGPSAGTAYALAIADLLDPADDARGRTVAATGTITADGTVGAVGGVAEKAVAARRAGADVLVVPRSEAAEASHAGVTMVAADTLSQAVTALRTG